MQINWFTVIAQIINFLILVWLLRRFLYKPILKAVDEREKKIVDQLKEAKVEKVEAKKEQEEFIRKNEEFDKQKKQLMDKAIAETKEQRQKLEEEARINASKLGAKLEEAARTSQEKFNQKIAQKTQEEVFIISRKVLTDIASVSLEEQTSNIFINRLRELKENEKHNFITSFSSNSDTIQVRSAFILSPKQETEIKTTIQNIIGDKTHCQFSTEPQLISGIELSTNGYSLSWNISEYLNSLKRNISEIINNNSTSEPENHTGTKKNNGLEEIAPKIEPETNEHAV